LSLLQTLLQNPKNCSSCSNPKKSRKIKTPYQKTSYLRPMIKISVEEAVTSIRREFRDLTNAEFNKGVMRAINHTISKLKTAGSREIRVVYNFKAGDINASTQIRRASANNLTAYIYASSKPTSLRRFGPNLTRTGISVVIKKGSRAQIAGAFIGPGALNQGVWARGRYNGGDFDFRHKRIRKPGGYKKIGNRYQPINNDLNINKLTTLSVHTAMTNNTVLTALQNTTESEFPKRMIHELSRMR